MANLPKALIQFDEYNWPEWGKWLLVRYYSITSSKRVERFPWYQYGHGYIKLSCVPIYNSFETLSGLSRFQTCQLSSSEDIFPLRWQTQNLYSILGVVCGLNFMYKIIDCPVTFITPSNQLSRWVTAEMSVTELFRYEISWQGGQLPKQFPCNAFIHVIIQEMPYISVTR